MTQANPIISANKSGLDYRAADNDGKQAIMNMHKGGSTPNYAEAGMSWLDDSATPWVQKFYDGSDWIVVNKINATDNSLSADFKTIKIDGVEVPYEEGQFTPTVYGSSAAGSATYTINQGLYTRIGNRVFGSYYIVMTSKGGLTGQVRIGDLPFTVQGGTAGRGGSVISFTHNKNLPAGSIGVNSLQIGTSIYLYRDTTTSGAISLLDTEINDTFSIYGAFSYQV